MSLKKSLLKNGIATGLQKLVRIAEQLLLIPFYISAWGVAYYGEWLTLTTVPSVLGFADLGFGTAAANTLVLRFASGDKQGAADASKSGYRLTSISAICGIITAGIILVVLIYWGVLNKALIPTDEAIVAVSFLMLARIIDFFQQVSEGYYRAARKAALSTNLLTFYALSKLVASLFILINKYGIVELAVTNLFLSLIFNLGYSFRAWSLLPLQKKLVGEIKKDDVKLITNKGLAYLMTPIWQAIYFQGTTIIVRVILGAEAVTLFNTVRTLCRSTNQVYSIINGAIFPDLQYEIGSGHLYKARKLFRVAVGFAGLSSIFGVFILFEIGPWLYEQWTNNALNLPLKMWYIFLSSIIFNSLWWTAGVIYTATNQPRDLARAGVISAILSTSLSFLLAKSYGLLGATLGSLSLEIIMAIYVLPNSCKIINQDIKRLPNEFLNDIAVIIQNFNKKSPSRIKKHLSNI